MKNLALTIILLSTNFIFCQTKFTFSKKNPAEIELLEYNKLLKKSNQNNYKLNEFQINQKFETILSKYGSFKLLTETDLNLKENQKMDSTIIYEFEIVEDRFDQNLKDRTTLLKQSSGDNTVHYYEANGLLQLRFKLYEKNSNKLIIEKIFSVTNTLRGNEKDNSYDAPKVDISLLKNDCVNTIIFSVLKYISDWQETTVIEFEDDNKFFELPSVISALNDFKWDEALIKLKRYAEDENLKTKQKSKALYNYGIVLLYHEDFDKAEEILNNALKIHQKDEKYLIAKKILDEEKRQAQIFVYRENKRNEELKKFQLNQDLMIKKENFTFENVDQLVAITGLREFKTVLYPSNSEEGEPMMFDFAEGFFEYNIINGTKTLNGNLDIHFGTPGFSNNVSGNIHDGNGQIIIQFFNNEIDHVDGNLKMIYDQNKCILLRLEKKDIESDSMYFFETNDLSKFNLDEKLFEKKGLIKINKTILGSVEFPLTRFLGYFDGEIEGSDLMQKEFKFIPIKRENNKSVEFGNVIDFKEKDLPNASVTILKNKKNINHYYKLECEFFTYKSEINSLIDTFFTLKKFEEIKIFEEESYANKYNEKISESELINLNNLVKKWVNSIIDGNYDTYKTLTPKLSWMNLQDFTKANAEFSRNKEKMVFQNSSRYIVTTIDIFSPTNSEYLELKKSGCNLNYVIVLYGNYKHFSEKEGISFIKENGVWKVVTIDKYGNKYEMKALFELSKENITACGCVQKVLEGNQYEADKCAYYIRNTRLMNQNEEFEKCFINLEYCDFVNQSKKLGVSFFSTNKFGTCLSK
jgi:hypothetical protein